MDEQNGLTVIPPQESRFLAPAATIQQAVDRFNMMGQFVKTVMHPDLDFGIIPGTNKPTLLKPGAEKLMTLFGLAARFTLVEGIYDWDGKDHDGESFFYFHYRCQVLNGERIIAEGEGSCNSWEKKYRYRTADLVCPDCGRNTLLKSKKEPGWFCWTKKGGCGATFGPNEKSITEQARGMVKNPDAADLVNTIQKMAQKRAYIAAVLLATNASEYFTQDMEDLADIVEGTFVDAPVASGLANKPAAPAPKEKLPEAQPPKKNGAKPSMMTQIAAGRQLAIAEAVALQTPKGSLLGDLDIDHLKVVLDKGTPELQAAARLLLAPASAEAIKLYDQLCEQAEAAHIQVVAAHKGITQGELYRQAVAVQAMITESQIPEGFR